MWTLLDYGVGAILGTTFVLVILAMLGNSLTQDGMDGIGLNSGDVYGIV